MFAVIDASVAVKWLLKEPDSDKARQLLNIGWFDLLLAPELMFCEVGNVLWRYVKSEEITHERAGALLKTLAELDITVSPVPSLVEDALAITYKLGHDAIYDSVYLALAFNKGAVLVTADKIFYKKVCQSPFQPHIRLLGEPIGENL